MVVQCTMSAVYHVSLLKVYLSAPYHEEITIRIILMRKELKGVSTGELLVHTVHAVLIQFGYNSVDCL